ncbi:VUT family protein [Sorangium sp. So ce388]|uniref:VUT family protein n=1 Tax=Sorangium sp. So ce388 TaxID=3133309 RepID=UPI003F5AE8DB
MKLTGLLWPAVYVGTVIGANFALKHWGIVPVGFGLEAPAGVYFAGLALAARDAVQERHGLRVALALVLLGAAVSALFAPGLALASAAAFLVSEVLDGLAWSRLRRHGAAVAVAGSGLVGAAIDTLLFLTLAFGSLRGFAGGVFGKLYATAAVAIAVVLCERARAAWRDW